jgi:putative peptide zinc metalloprotease protein
MPARIPIDYCEYPPQPATDVEISEQRDGDRLSWFVGSAAVGRYVILRETEFRVFQLLDGERTPQAVCEEFQRQYGGKLPLTTLQRFIQKLDDSGIMAGTREVSGYGKSSQQVARQPYIRFNLFNPDRLFARMVPLLRWVWTPEFVSFTVLTMLLAMLLVLLNLAEVSSYGSYILREHFAAVIVAALLVVASHEFAHGLTCKAFGGRATEVGALLIYYFLPALYCNVSGIHLIQKRSRRLWVIAAGVYWQMLVGTFALLAWFVFTPYTLIADLAFITFLGSVLNLAFNANPLIKLDGYYFFSQWLRLPNLMDRSRTLWRSFFSRIFTGETDPVTLRWNWREKFIYATFGLLSTAYTIALTFFIVRWVGGYLIDSFNLLGLLLTSLVALLFLRRPFRQMLAALQQGWQMVVRIPGTEEKTSAKSSRALARTATQSVAPTQSPVPATTAASPATTAASTAETKPFRWRRALVPTTLLLIAAVALLLPWEASVGSYGTLIAIPGEEVIIRAPESATLLDLKVRPGDKVTSGHSLGRLGNIEVDEQLAQLQSDLARANADYDKLLGELRTRNEAAYRAELQLRQRQRDYEDINSEQQQIQQRKSAESRAEATRDKIASTNPADLGLANDSKEKLQASYPPAIAAMQADIDLRRARLDEAKLNLERARKLHTQGLLPRSDLDTVETRASTLSIELAAAQERLEAALVEHRRKHTNVATEMYVARSDVGAEKLQAARLGSELSGMRSIIRTLEERRTLLQRKQSQFDLTTPRGGTVFGEDLPRMVGQYFQKGAEICRIADTRQLLVRILVTEREIGDVRVGLPVRLKARSFPDQVFHGVVSKIGGESELDEHNQAVYRVELTIENKESWLRPGMTAFARIDFGKQPLGRIAWHKIKQALRPELWML